MPKLNNSARSKLSHKNNIKTIVLVPAIICILAIISYVWNPFNWLEYTYGNYLKKNILTHHYGVIIDCGSTGSRAHVFKWPVTSDGKPSSLQDIDLLRNEHGQSISKQINPGLSSFRDNLPGVEVYMDNLMRFINDTVPVESHSFTQIYVLATAGMRLLDKSTQLKLLEAIATSHKDKYKFTVTRSQIISGRLEGAFSWISLNSKNRLSKPDGISRGIIELGGASAQVTYEVTPDIEDQIVSRLDQEAVNAFRNEQFTFEMRQNETFRLFSTTFLGLGVSSARQFTLERLLEKYLDQKSISSPDDKPILEDPCLNKNYKEVYNNTNMKILSDRKIDSLTYKGSGDFEDCLKLLEEVVDKAKTQKINCQNDSLICPMDFLRNDFIPHEIIPIVGLSEFYFTTNEMLKLSGDYDHREIVKLVKEICSTDYHELIKKYSNSNISEPDRIPRQCFKASWMLTILHYAFKVPENYKNLSNIERMDNRLIDWTVGAMMKKAVEHSQQKNHMQSK